MTEVLQHIDAERVRETDESQAVGQAVRAMREGCRLTAGQLGALADMAPSRIGRIEHGAPSYPWERHSIAAAVAHYCAGVAR